MGSRFPGQRALRRGDGRCVEGNASVEGKSFMNVADRSFERLRLRWNALLSLWRRL